MNAENKATLAGIVVIGLFALVLGIAWTSPTQDGITVYAEFTSVEGLRVGSPVRMAGVEIGVSGEPKLQDDGQSVLVPLYLSTDIISDAAFSLESVTATSSEHGDDASAEMQKVGIPVDSAVAIQTDGLIGAKFLQVFPGFEVAVLQHEDSFATTYDAIQLLDLLDKIL
ncbi:MAG: MlaD family protein [Alphaproteobacteria bacterium]|nr:MlaD family protein [Alphaproteobacteria bacterium]